MDIFKSYQDYVLEIRQQCGKMGTPKRHDRAGSTPYANGRNKKKNKIRRKKNGR